MLESNAANRTGGGIAVIDGSFFASNITLGTEGAGNTAGPEGIALRGNGGGFHSSGIAKASFVGGNVEGNSASGEGGGIWNSADGTLFVSGVNISNNEARGNATDQGGGGIFNEGGNIQIAGNTVIQSNTASGSGGGIFSTDGQVFVDGSSISFNTANRAGGGIEIINGRFVVRSSELEGNIAGPEGSEAPGNGGGLHVSGNQARVFIRNSSVVDNFAASEGGGLWNQEGSFLRVDGFTLIGRNVAAGDDADNGGGGIFNNGGNVTVLQSTIF